MVIQLLCDLFTLSAICAVSNQSGFRVCVFVCVFASVCV